MTLQLTTGLPARLGHAVARIGSRAEAAKAGGTTERHLGDCLGGRTVPSVELLARLAETSGTSLDWLILGAQQQSAADVIGPRLEPGEVLTTREVLDELGAALAALDPASPRYDEARTTALALHAKLASTFSIAAGRARAR